MKYTQCKISHYTILYILCIMWICIVTSCATQTINLLLISAWHWTFDIWHWTVIGCRACVYSRHLIFDIWHWTLDSFKVPCQWTLQRLQVIIICIVNLACAELRWSEKKLLLQMLTLQNANIAMYYCLLIQILSNATLPTIANTLIPNNLLLPTVATITINYY